MKSSFSKQDYLQKSRSQTTAAWILLGAGTALIAIAARGNVSFDILPVLVVGGGAAIIGSIPLFISAGKNKRRAEAVTASLMFQQIAPINFGVLSKRAVPGVALRFRF